MRIIGSNTEIQLEQVRSVATTANASANQAKDLAATAMPIAGGEFTGPITSSSSLADLRGNLRALPQKVRTSNYTISNDDVGRLIVFSGGVLTVPSGVFAEGDVVTIYNASDSTKSLSTSGTTFRMAGTLSTGARSLLARGLCTILCVAPNEFILSGSGLV